MTGSYNETLSTVFSKQVRNSIQEIKVDESKIVYSDIFPNTRIQQGDGAMNLWTLEVLITTWPQVRPEHRLGTAQALLSLTT